MNVRLLGRKRPPIRIKIKPFAAPFEVYNNLLLKIYNQAKEDYKNGQNTNQQ